jgi:hypothetical protein
MLMINKVWKSRFNMVQMVGIVKDVTNFNRSLKFKLYHYFKVLIDDYSFSSPHHRLREPSN